MVGSIHKREAGRSKCVLIGLRRQEYVVVICNSISVKIVLIRNYSLISVGKNNFILAWLALMDIKRGGGGGFVTVDIQEAAGHPVLYDNFYLFSIY